MFVNLDAIVLHLFGRLLPDANVLQLLLLVLIVHCAVQTCQDGPSDFVAIRVQLDDTSRIQRTKGGMLSLPSTARTCLMGNQRTPAAKAAFL